MAQAHARLGCLVTVLEAAPRIAAREDAELVEGLRPFLRADGVEIREGARVARVERPGDGTGGVVAVLEDGARVAGTHLLLAIGRAPRLSGLDLPAGSVAASPRGIATRRDLRSVSNRRVWAVGDIADPEGLGPRAFTHVASQHAGIVVRSMLFRLPGTRLDYDALPRVTYTDPELAQVGLTEAEAREAGHREVSVLRWPLSENDRAIAEGRPEGLGQAGGRAPRAAARRRHPGAARGRDGRALRADDRAADCRSRPWPGWCCPTRRSPRRASERRASTTRQGCCRRPRNVLSDG